MKTLTFAEETDILNQQLAESKQPPLQTIGDYLEPLLDNPSYKPCNCEDCPCCGH